MIRRTAKSAFTLLELVLVMAILAIALAIAAPSMHGWGHGAKLRDAVDQMLAMTRYAQAQAVTDGKIYRLNFDPSANTYWLTAQDGTNYINLPSAIGQIYTLPQGTRFELSPVPPPSDSAAPPPPSSPDAQTAGSGNIVNFYPTGRTDAVRITLSMDDGRLAIECSTPAEAFHQVQQGSSS